MGSYATKMALETYIQANWTQTSVQWEGEPFSTASLSKWISVKYVGVSNEQGFSGRKALNAQLQVFAYTKHPPLSHKLADDISAMLSCLQLGDIEVRVGQVQGSALKMDNGFYEVLVTFEVDNYS